MLDTIRKLLALFDREEHVELAGIVLAMIVSGLLQTVGIASIMPFLAVVSNPSIVTENDYLAWTYETLGFSSVNQFLFMLGAVFIVVMVTSRAFETFTAWATARFQWRSHERISGRLLAQYLEAPYSFHLGHNSAELGSRLLDDVRSVIEGVLLPGANFLTRAIASVFIVSLLVAVDPLLAVLVFALIAGFYSVVFALIRKRQSALGEEVIRAKRERYRIVDEAFGGIKDIKVLGREGFFMSRYSGPSHSYASAQSKAAVVGLLPKLALETLAYGGIVAVILYLLQTRESLDQILPLLAVYAFGANRLMPAVQEMFWSLARIRFGGVALDDLYRDLRGVEASVVGSDMSPLPDSVARAQELEGKGLKSEIRFTDVTFAYPDARDHALDRVNLQVCVNQTVGLVGETGSGKTTLVDLLLGLYEPMDGEITIDGVALDATSLPAWRRRVGYVPQAVFLSDASIARNIAFGVPDDLVDEDAVREAARAAHLDGFVSTLADGYETIVGERGIRLSGGQRQRIGIARALYHRPDVLVMDEATSALDNITEDVVMQAIRDLAKRRTIVLIAHRLTTVQDCDVIYLLERGRVVAQGTYEELVASNPVFKKMARA